MSPNQPMPSSPAAKLGGAGVERDDVQLAGRIGRLSESQQAAFEQFQRRLTEEGYYSPAQEGEEASHDDTTLLRFLRARKFDVEAGLHQFIATENWRKENNIDTLYDEFDPEEFVMSQSVYTQWTGRRTKAGQPLYLYRVRDLSKQRVADYSSKPERLVPRMMALTEMMTAFTLPFTSSLPRPHPEVPIDATTTIVDIGGVSLSRFWNLRTHMQRASTLATANYPETIGVLFIVGAPSFFSVVWGWVNRWFDQGTVEKMFILSGPEVFPTLTKFIDPVDIPQKYGGTLDWDFGDAPNLDQDALTKLGIKSSDELPKGALRWDEKRGLRVVGKGRTERDLRMNGRGARERSSPIEGGIGAVGDKKFDNDSENVVAAEEEGSATSESTLAPPLIDESPKHPLSDLEKVQRGAKDNQAASKMFDLGSEKVKELSSTSAPTALEAAKQVPSAPIKDLAAALEGTTL